MAEVLDKLPLSRRRGAWNYSQYCDGRVYRLRGGVDVGESYNSVTASLYYAAARLGKRAITRLESINPLVIVVQAMERE